MLHCTSFMAPDGEELLAVIFGEEDLKDEKRLHLAHCPTCQQRLKGYQQTHSLLSQFYRALCPDGTQLTLYCKQALSPDNMFTIADHLHECHLCQEEVKAIRLEFANFTPFPEQAEEDILWKWIREGLKCIFAQSLIQRPAMSLRHDAPVSQWPLRYTAGQFRLTFQLSHANNDRLNLIGFFEELSLEQLQVLEGMEVNLYPVLPSESNEQTRSEEHKQPIMSTIVDDMGNFTFTAIPSGEYVAIIHLSDTELVVEGLSIT